MPCLSRSATTSSLRAVALIAAASGWALGCGASPSATAPAADITLFEISGDGGGGAPTDGTSADAAATGDTAAGDSAASDAVAGDTVPSDSGAADASADTAATTDAAPADTPAADGGSQADTAPDSGGKPDASNNDAAADASVCKPDCKDLECGDDGCGGVCGKCPAAAPDCVAGLCSAACVGSCTGKICGDNGCGASCGSCGASTYCKAGTSCAAGTECAAMAGCSVACGSDDKCLDGCFEFASIEGLLDLSDWQSCLLTNCFAAKNALTCIANKCLTEYVTCYAGKPGVGTCKELSTCSGPCGGDLSCIGLCQAKSTLTASGAYLKYLACIAEVCPKGSDANCAATALGPSGGCKVDYDACINN